LRYGANVALQLHNQGNNPVKKLTKALWFATCAAVTIVVGKIVTVLTGQPVPLR
jgi:hypothetical protein